MLKEIYEMVACKDLTFWSVMIGDLLEFQKQRVKKYYPMFIQKTEWMNRHEKYKEYKRFIEKMWDKIIYLDDSGDYDYYEWYDLMDMWLGDIWEDMRKPLDEQPLDTIRRVHDLVTSHNTND